MTPYERVRLTVVLHSAWAKVRASGLASKSESIKGDTLAFDADWLNNINKIYRHLQRETFRFDEEHGITPPKGKGKSGLRPMVIGSIPNRIVRRAILDVLQGYGSLVDHPRKRWAGIPAVRSVMATPTSIGGIVDRGVPVGLALIDTAVRNRQHWFIRSDIRNFFTRIPTREVKNFIAASVNDARFTALFNDALNTNLRNQRELEERDLFKLFPDPELGMAQGSALSALAGNIALRGFDARMNDKGIVCVRYIDDFIILGKSFVHVQKAYGSARAILKDMGMDVHDLSDQAARRDGKAHSGNIYDGTEVLGYCISGNSRHPCKKACANFLQKIDVLLSDGAKAMNKAAGGQKIASNAMLYHQTIVQVNRVTWSWSQAFAHTTARHVFVDLDREIDKRLRAFDRTFEKLTGSAPELVRRKVRGVHLLEDTPKKEFPASGPPISAAA